MPFDIPDNDVAFNPTQSTWMSADIDVLALGFSGTGVLTGSGVTAQGSPDMTLAVAAGTIRIASGAAVTVTAGNITITTADATNPRVDLVSASNAGVKTVTAGTPAVSPKCPDLPAGNVALAMVYVPANDTTMATNQIVDKRVLLPSITLGYFAPGSFTVPSGAFTTVVRQLVLTGTQQAVLQGTAVLRVI